MSFTDLHEHIQGTFAAFSGADEYEAQLTLWCFRQRQLERERQHAYQAAHPQRFRTLKAARQKRWLANRPTTQCSRCTEPAVEGKRSCETHLKYDRQRWHRRAA